LKQDSESFSLRSVEFRALGIDFFNIEVLTWRGLATYYLLFFIHLETRRVTLAGITRHPTEEWMAQVARNAVDETSGSMRHIRFVLHDI
jgi:putative transposase